MSSTSFSHRTRRTRTRLITAGSIAALVAASLTACQPSLPSPNETARAVAESLNSGDFSTVPQTEDSVAPDLEKAFAALTKAERTVELVGAEQHPQDEDNKDAAPTATATYKTSWDFSGIGIDKEWDYTSTAELVYDEEAEQWQATLSPSLAAPELDEGEVISYQATAGKRGKILGANKESIVTDRPVRVIGLDKTDLDDDQAAASARQLAAALNIGVDDYVAKVAGYPENSFVEALTLRADEYQDSMTAGITGATAKESTLPLAPSRAYANGIFGTVGEATAEDLEKAEKAEKPLPRGVLVGQSGIQQTQNKALTGDYGLTLYAGKDEILELPATDGKNVRSSIDVELQKAATETLANTGHNSAIVAIRPSDGAVLAAVSGPGENAAPVATQYRYAPGSTFKLVTALGMLRNGITPETEVECPATTLAAGQVFKNYDAYPAQYLGTIPFATAIAQSCNTVFANQWDTVTGPKLGEAAAALGLNNDAKMGVEGLFMGSVPTDSEGNLHAANLFGQGVIETSVLGMATVTASIAKGATVTPKFVLEPELADGKAPAKPLTEEEGAALKSMMAGTVENGTLPILQELPAPKAQAKTGTAEFIHQGEEEAHTWVVAIHGDLAVAVFVEIGWGGAITSGPLAKDFLIRAHEIQKDRDN
ncbi:penicillin-binding transpeptidase domain-containing protein [Micrococcoides hystricis]|uniref:Beta-lactamase n=1 Tax=Micrococcoides hystricis TaxID=1572761 RepID=A0ABV6PF30_9MICC